MEPIRASLVKCELDGVQDRESAFQLEPTSGYSTHLHASNRFRICARAQTSLLFIRTSKCHLGLIRLLGIFFASGPLSRRMTGTALRARDLFVNVGVICLNFGATCVFGGLTTRIWIDLSRPYDFKAIVFPRFYHSHLLLHRPVSRV